MVCMVMYSQLLELGNHMKVFFVEHVVIVWQHVMERTALSQLNLINVGCCEPIKVIDVVCWQILSYTMRS